MTAGAPPARDSAVYGLQDALCDPELFAPWFDGATWATWRAVLKAAFGQPLSAHDLEIFHEVAGDRDPPEFKVRELWIIAGRRAGKDSIASVIAAHAAGFGNYGPYLRRGERAVVSCLGVDRSQSKIVLGYTRAFFDDIPMLRALVKRETADGLELTNGCDIEIATNNFRRVRGRTLALAILDECAFYRDENSSSPDVETYNAILPSLTTIPGAMLIGISSPYRRAGLLWEKYRKHYGKSGDILVIKGASKLFNPTIDQRIIDQQLERDPAAARAEWLGEFRTDIEGFVTQEVIEAAIVSGRRELPKVPGRTYRAFCDPSGGSADSFACAIAHREGDKGVLDCVREFKPPFSPDQVIGEIATLLKAYGVHEVTGDRYSAEFVVEAFRKCLVTYKHAEHNKSDVYREVLPLLNSGRVELLDNTRLAAQLVSLERRTSRSGKDSIDHPPGQHDDLANASAGALVLVAAKAPMKISDEALARSKLTIFRRPSIGAARPHRFFH